MSIYTSKLFILKYTRLVLGRVPSGDFQGGSWCRSLALADEAVEGQSAFWQQQVICKWNPLNTTSGNFFIYFWRFSNPYKYYLNADLSLIHIVRES